MKKISLAALAAVAALFAIVPALRAQVLPAGSAAPQSLDDRREALNDLFHEYWEDYLKHNPEFASEIGDKRYNDQISDYCVRAVNDTLAREQNFLMRLAAIDTTGFTDQEKISQELLLRRFEDRRGGCGVQGVGDAGESDGRHLRRPIRNWWPSSASPR